MTGTGYYLRDIGGGVKKYKISKVGGITFYVKTTGDDNNDGLSSSTAKKTIQSAINDAPNWSVIYIKGGTYEENLVISKDNLTLIGESPNDVIVTSSSGETVSISSTYQVNLYNLDIISTSTSVGDSAVAHGYISGMKKKNNIINCVIESDTYGVKGGGNYHIEDTIIRSKNPAVYLDGVVSHGTFKTSHAEVEYCDIIQKDTGGTDKTGIKLLGASYVLIHDCNIYDWDTGGVYTLDGYNNRIYHNNFSNNTVNITDSGGTGNYIFENHYSDHTNIDNGFGICTEPYSYTGGVDIRPVPFVDGWRTVSLNRSVLRKNTYGYDTASSVTFNGTSWVDLKEATVSVDTQLTGIKMTITGTLAGTGKYKILRDGVKVFPYNTENTIESGVLREFDYAVNIPINSTYKIQIRSTDASDTTQTIVADEIDKIEVV